MVKFKFKYLYHTTSILTEDTKDFLTDNGEMNYHAKMGEFPTALEAPKFFTIGKRCDYQTTWICTHSGKEYRLKEVFLRYTVLKELDLYDNMANPYRRPGQEQLEGYDGFFGQEDCIEVYLKNPSEVLDPNFEIIEFSKIKCFGEECQCLVDQHKV